MGKLRIYCLVPCCRALLAVTSRGRAYLWTQGEGASGSGAGAGTGAAGGGAATVRCINSWVGSPAFQVRRRHGAVRGRESREAGGEAQTLRRRAERAVAPAP